MTKSTIKSVLIIGAGANDVQHGDELDATTYLVTTVFKRLGIQTILADDNPFSVSLENRAAVDHACIGPLNVENLVQLIRRYRPRAILPTLGNRRAFELTQELLEKGIVQECNIKLLGIPEATIRQINNPVLLSRTLHQMGAPMKSVITVNNYQDALSEARKLGYPVIIRSVLPKNSSTRRIVHDERELAPAVQSCLSQSRAEQVLVQQSLAGYKEIEAVVQRDSSGTMMMLSMVEDMDPIGIHAGDSIAFNPPQTLLDRQIQDMRDTAFAITRKLRIVGINHVQFALDPESSKFYVIKNSPYFDRIASFVAQSTGYPIAEVCAQLYTGKLLRDIDLGPNYAYHAALIEPAMDHIAARVPVWGFNTIPSASPVLGTEKKSIGTVFGVGRTTIEALFKALESRYQEPTDFHLTAQKKLTDDELIVKLVHPAAGRLFVLIEAMNRGYSVEELSEMTKIDPYYFDQINQMRLLIKKLLENPNKEPVLIKAKGYGLSNQLIAHLWKTTPHRIDQMEVDHGLTTKYKEIEPSAGEFPQHTNSFYSAFEDENEGTKTAQPSAVIIGTGGLRLGLSNSGDYFVAQMMRQLHQEGYHTVIVNTNPSSISLCYRLSDKRYIEPPTLENVVQILKVEQPQLLFVPASYQQLLAGLSNLDLDCRLISLPDDRLPQLDNQATQLVAFNYICDGEYAYPLGTVTNLLSPEQLNYQSTALRYPAEIADYAFQKLNDTASDEVMKQDQLGLYQVVFAVAGDEYHQIGVQPLPLPEIAFLSKVLQINLPGVYVQLLTGTLTTAKMMDSLNQATDPGVVTYRATFPFRALNVPNETPAFNKIIGAQMRFLTNQQ